MKRQGTRASTTRKSGASGAARPLETPAATGHHLSKIGYLSAMELFAGVTPDEMEQVSQAVAMKTVPPGTLCYVPGESGEVMFLLKKGTVRLYRLSPAGQKLVLGRLTAFSFFGEMSVLGQGMYDSFAETEDECVLCAMSRADVERHIFSRPQLVVRILEAVGRRMVEVERMLDDATFKTLVQRIASLLLREASADKVEALTHQDIAERLGVYRESATLALSELKNAGIIATGRKHITIIDRNRLRRIAAAETERLVFVEGA